MTHFEYSLVLSDSEVASVTRVAPDIQVRFSAAATRQVDPTVDMEHTQGFSRGVLLQLHGATITREQEPHLGRLSGSRLQVDGQFMKRIYIPFEFKGPVHLELAFANSTHFVADGTGISVRFEAEPNFTESLAC